MSAIRGTSRLAINHTPGLEGLFPETTRVLKVCECCDAKEEIATFTGPNQQHDAEVFVEAIERGDG